MTAALGHANGGPALILSVDGEIDSVVTMRVEEGMVSAIYTVRNPEKLSAMTTEATVSR